MKADELLDLIGQAQDEYIDDAKNPKKKTLPSWAKWTAAAAACLAAVVGIGGFVMLNMGGAQAGGSSQGLEYMYYAGPVLPLTLAEAAPGIQASRQIDFDLSGYVDAVITDGYTLTNTADEDITVTALYPFVSSLSQKDQFPIITVGGGQTGYTLYAGPYSGGFEGVWGSNEEGTANLRGIRGFTGYEALLSDSSYMASAFDEAPVLDQRVYVYTLSDYVYTTDANATNPTINFEFYKDYSKTTVLTYGSNGGRWDYEAGFGSRCVSSIEYRSNVSEEFQHPDEAYIIVLGEDLISWQIQGYRDGGCDRGEEVDDLSCTVTRTESTLGEVLRKFVAELSEDGDTAMLYDLSAELLATTGPIGTEPVQRYADGMLESLIIEAKNNTRVFYCEFSITVPAGQSVEIVSAMTKEASQNFVGDDTDRNAYDMATTLGSSLTFTAQTASISGYEGLRILRQNFGFDPENGITEVALDLSEPHYWLEVQLASPPNGE